MGNGAQEAVSFIPLFFLVYLFKTHCYYLTIGAMMKRPHKTGNSGFTLIEVAAVVAIIGVLAAVLFPVIRDKIGEAKETRTKKDVQMLAVCIEQLYLDTGYWPLNDHDPKGFPGIMILATKAGTTPNYSGSAIWTSQAWEGVLPTYSLGVEGGVDAFSNHLVINAAGYDGKDWKGAYLSEVKSDPWGHKYLCNIGFITKRDDQGVYANAVFVLSAGPNGIVETPAEQSLKTATIAGDDIAYRIR